MWSQMLLLAGAGALGTVARFLLTTWVQRMWPLGWPGGTLVVNVVGCLLAGIVYAFLEYYDLTQSAWRLILLVGYMGAFTTFSALILESDELYRSANWLSALGYLGLQIGLGVLALRLGWWLVQQALPMSASGAGSS